MARARLLGILFTVGMMLAGSVGVGGVRAQSPLPSTGERVVVTPGEGTGLTRFRFTGSGFVPGRTVSIRLSAPDGSERRFVAEDGAEVVWVVAPDGTFVLDFAPSLHFPGTPPGNWDALFCGFGAATCQLLNFDVIS